jgi:cell wall-associated NlpC family hydrolase
MKDKRFTIDEDAYSFDGQAFLSGNSTREAIVDTALMYLNSPYLWGGRSPFGIDCSGLVQMVYRIHGYKLLRDAAMQSSQGTQVSFVEAAEPGDVAFFENQEGQIIHTGILLAGGKIIHASGRVRIDDIDHEGIYNRELNKYTHKLRLIKSFL